MRLHNGPQVLFTVQMPLKSLCVESKSKQRLRGWDIVGIPEHRDTAEQTSSQEVYVETPIGLRQVYGRRRKCDHGIIMFFVSCLGQFQSVFHLLFTLLLLNSMSSSSFLSLYCSFSGSPAGWDRLPAWAACEGKTGLCGLKRVEGVWGIWILQQGEAECCEGYHLQIWPRIVSWTGHCADSGYTTLTRRKKLKYKPKLFWCTKPVNPS